MGFATGFQTGANAVNAYKDRARLAKLDARDEERFKREQDTYAREEKLRRDMQTAGQAATVNESAPTLNTGDGAKVYDMENGADVAASDARQFKRMMPEAPAPVQSQAFAVNGKAYDTREAMQQAAKEYDAPDARNQRYQTVLQANGKPLEALQMQNAVMDSQAKKLGLDAAQLSFANDQFNAKIMERVSGPDWHTKAADLLTETQVGGMAGATVTVKPSADGQKFEFVANKDGKTSVLGSFSQGEAGLAQFLQGMSRVPVTKKIEWFVEATKSKQTQANADRDFDLRKSESESNQQYRNRMLSVQQSQEGRAQALHKLTMADAKIPPGVKLQAQSLAKQIENIGTALNKAMAEGQFDPNNPGTKSLLEQQAVLGMQYEKLMENYTPGAQSKGDVLWLGKQEKAPPAPMAEEVKRTSPVIKATTNGSHKPRDNMIAPPIQSTPVSVQQKLRDIDMRLALQGIGDDTRLRLMLERKLLTEQSPMSMAASRFSTN